MFELFIAKRIYRDKNGGKKVSRPAVLIAITGIAIGLAIMIVALSIVIGFKRDVRVKVVGFGSDIQISNFDAVRSYETMPVVVNDSLITVLDSYPEVKHVQRYTTKPGMIKTDDAFLGMVLKGVGQEFDSSFFREHLLEGDIPLFTDSVASNQVIVSKAIADKLRLKLDDRIYTYYLQEKTIRARRLEIVGIYQTNFSEYDNLFLLTDIYTVNRLNSWYPEQASGIEIQVYDYSRLDDITYTLAGDIDNMEDEYGGIYYVRNVEQLHPQIFVWLEVIDFNIWIILILLIGVAGFTVISGLLIIILERTNMIGILKSLGAGNLFIRKIFLWFAVFLIGRGMILGNIFGLAFYFIQSHFGLLKLDPETYYMDTVPVSMSFGELLILNIGTFIISVLMLIGPSFLITKINPASSMRYE